MRPIAETASLLTSVLSSLFMHLIKKSVKDELFNLAKFLIDKERIFSFGLLYNFINGSSSILFSSFPNFSRTNVIVPSF